MTNLSLAATQKEVKQPFCFTVTRINVYSLEEAAYHCYSYYSESADDFLGDTFLEWVKDTLELPFIASKLRKLRGLSAFSDRLIGFIKLCGCSHYGLDTLRHSVANWEQRKDWEKLKERADFLYNHGEYEAALKAYRVAAEQTDEARVWNNLGLCLMKLRRAKEAAVAFQSASKCAESAYQCTIKLNLAEAYINAGSTELADALITKIIEDYGATAETCYLRGCLEISRGHALSAATFFETAISVSDKPLFRYATADCYVKLRYYDKALAVLELIENKDKQFLIAQSRIYAAAENLTAAIRCMERALLAYSNDVEIWRLLAMYHRLNINLDKAYSAIVKAKQIAPDNLLVMLEAGRIRKAQGKVKDYQNALRDLLKQLQENYFDA